MTFDATMVGCGVLRTLAYLLENLPGRREPEATAKIWEEFALDAIPARVKSARRRRVHESET
jgi:hypothetical protein